MSKSVNLIKILLYMQPLLILNWKQKSLPFWQIKKLSSKAAVSLREASGSASKNFSLRDLISVFSTAAIFEKEMKVQMARLGYLIS